MFVVPCTSGIKGACVGEFVWPSQVRVLSGRCCWTIIELGVARGACWRAHLVSSSQQELLFLNYISIGNGV